MNATHHGQLDGLRFVAFMAVFVHHALHVPLLWIGVDQFFVLSGYLITGILIRTRGSTGYFRLFYIRRALRIFPAYYVVLALAFLALYPGHERAVPWFLAYLSNFNSAWSLTPIPRPINLMWSLAIEEQFYLIWPLVLAHVAPRRVPALCVTLIVTANVARAVCAFAARDHWPAYYLLPTRMDLLAVGGLIATLEHVDPSALRNTAARAGWASLASLAMLACLGLFLPTFRTSSNSLLFNTLGYSLICVVAGGCLLYVVHGPSGVLQRALRWGPMRYLGNLSYACYLVHMIALDQVRRLLSDRLGVAVVALAVTLVASWLLWVAIERPVRRFKDLRFSYSR